MSGRAVSLLKYSTSGAGAARSSARTILAPISASALGLRRTRAKSLAQLPTTSLTHRQRALSTKPSSEASSAEGTASGSNSASKADAGTESESVPFWKRGLQVQWIFGGLAGLGALITIYGLLEFYSTLTTWPKAVRKPLRAALKAKLRQDYNKAELFFREALATATEIGPVDLQPDPLLKLSGIYVELANVLEIKGQRPAAFSELRNALVEFGPDPLNPSISGNGGGSGTLSLPKAGEWAGEGYALTPKDHIRAIGLYQKLGQLALEIATTPRMPAFASLPASSSFSAAPSLKTWDEAAEHYLSSALTAMLRLGLSSRPEPASSTQVIAGRDIDLPSGVVADPNDPEAELDPDQGGRVDKRGLGMTMESLSEVYARKGQYDMAAQLLLQAVSLLLPPGTKETPAVRDRCQAALLMTTISSHASHPKTAQSTKVSRSWSLRSLQLSEQALRERDSSDNPPAQGDGETALEVALGVCKRARSVGLYNLGMLAEMEKDNTAALEYFQKALTSARAAAFPEGKREAMAAIRRIQKEAL